MSYKSLSYMLLDMRINQTSCQNNDFNVFLALHLKMTKSMSLPYINLEAHQKFFLI